MNEHIATGRGPTETTRAIQHLLSRLAGLGSSNGNHDGAQRLIAGRLGRAALLGALGGLYGSGAMSAIRLAMHRAGAIDKMVPQAVIRPEERSAGN
jgi:hypothetical protein